MKVKALDSFATAETGMIHAGEEVDTANVSQDRLDEWARRGFIPATKKEPAPQNKAEPAPVNKADPLDHDGNGRKGGAKSSAKGK